MKIDTVEFAVIEAAETELAAYQNGEINVADNLSANAMQTYKDTDEYYNVDRIGIRYMDFNTEHAPFDNKLVRQAFAMSIDRQLLIDRILETSESAVLGFVPEGAALSERFYQVLPRGCGRHVQRGRCQGAGAAG